MRIRSVLGHALQAIAEGSLIAMLIVGLMAGSTFAGKGSGGKPGSGGSGGSLAVVMVADANGNGAPNHADTITFNVTTSADRPFVSVNCYQGSAWVYAASVGYFADYPWSKDFILSASSWTGGAADCTARLYTSKDGIRTTTLATLSFAVGA
jgi:hypothetical protein